MFSSKGHGLGFPHKGIIATMLTLLTCNHHGSPLFHGYSWTTCFTFKAKQRKQSQKLGEEHNKLRLILCWSSLVNPEWKMISFTSFSYLHVYLHSEAWPQVHIQSMHIIYVMVFAVSSSSISSSLCELNASELSSCWSHSMPSSSSSWGSLSDDSASSFSSLISSGLSSLVRSFGSSF